MSDLPVLGCAMELHNLEKMAPWVLEKIEIWKFRTATTPLFWIRPQTK